MRVVALWLLCRELVALWLVHQAYHQHRRTAAALCVCSTHAILMGRQQLSPKCWPRLCYWEAGAGASACGQAGRGCAQHFFVHYACWWAHGDWGGLVGWGGVGWGGGVYSAGGKVGWRGLPGWRVCVQCVNVHWAVYRVSVTMVLPQVVGGLSVKSNKKHQFTVCPGECLSRASTLRRNPGQGTLLRVASPARLHTVCDR